MQPFRFTIRQLLEATTWAAVECLCLREAAITMRGPVYLLGALAIWLVGGFALGNLFGTFVGNRVKCCVMAVCLWPLTAGIVVGWIW